MSDLGPVQYESGSGNVFLGRDYFKEKTSPIKLHMKLIQKLDISLQHALIKLKQLLLKTVTY